MKKITFWAIILLSIYLVSCENNDSDYTSSPGNVVDYDNTTTFQEMFMLVNIKTSDSTYLVVESIDSLTIFVNNQFWAKANSNTIDTEHIIKNDSSNYSYTKNKLNYLVTAKQQALLSDFSTIGDYAKYLNDQISLKDGEYACLIESFQVTFNDGTRKKFAPYAYTIFTVEPNTYNAYLGEIELKIY
ncbi:MAG: hypothetical protein PF444_08740 [Bacteroidales bacterium]|jgi:hypothetical protein|nr:hypothetical protein [Bacteroidales bacterium]